MNDEIQFESFIRHLIQTLNDCGIKYMMIGGVAAVHYGRPRTTSDCDITISLEEDQLEQFAECMEKHDFCIHKEGLLEAFRDKGHFTAFYANSVFRVDFSWKKGSLAEYGFRRAKETALLGLRVMMEAPEDVIIAKLVYGSPQDLDDAKAIVLVQKALDREYLLKRADEEGVKDKLVRILDSEV